MPKFSFKALSLEGKTVKGVREALSIDHLEKQLLQEQLAALWIKEQRQARLCKMWKRSVNEQDLIFLFNYLVALTSRGVSLVNAVQLFGKQVNKPALLLLISTVQQQVTKGASFAQALRLSATTLPNFVVLVIERGESTGHLDEALREVIDFLEDRKIFRRSLLKAILFPTITICAALVIFLGMFIFIIPQFEQLFTSLDKPIPIATQRVIAVSHMVQSWWFMVWIILLPLQFLVLKYLVALRVVRERVERLLLCIPLVGNCCRDAATISFLKAFALFLKSGFPLKQACEQAVVTLADSPLRVFMQEVVVALNHGSSLVGGLKKHASQYFDDNTLHFIAVGEQSGTLNVMLEQAISLLGNSFKDRLALITVMVQPTLLLLIGAGITALLIATYLPIFSLATAIN